jgi:myo-inositol-1(or 4)-monophosphatase
MKRLPQKDLQDWLKIALEAAYGAGEILKRHWGKLSGVSEKSHPGDLVTIADLESEKLIVDLLHNHYPNHSILAEESGVQFVSKYPDENAFIWAIDPLDGTTNYTHNFPMVCVSIALLYQQKPVVAVVYNPIVNELFYATQGQGAFLNGAPICVSKVSEVSRSLLATGFAYDRCVNPDNNLPEFCKLTLISQGVRRMGSAALDLAYVAAGRLDGYWERGLQPWDMAAGALLVEEAGGVVTDHDQCPFQIYSGRILAANGILNSAFSEALISK